MTDIEELRETLRRLAHTVPAWLGKATLHETQAWKRRRDEAIKVLNKRNATAFELKSAIKSVSEK